jgi:hypothetical protein
VQQLHTTSEMQSDQKIEISNDPSQKIGSKLPVKSLLADQKEWQGNVSKRDKSCQQQENPIHVLRARVVNEVSSPSWVGISIEPVS